MVNLFRDRIPTDTVTTFNMPESRWLNLELFSDSDSDADAAPHSSAKDTSSRSSSNSTSYLYHITGLPEEHHKSTSSQATIHSTWLQLQLSSEESSDVLSDDGLGQSCPKDDDLSDVLDQYTQTHGESLMTGPEQSCSKDDDLSDVLDQYTQIHGGSLMTDTEEDLQSDDFAEDYQPESSEECAPAQTRSFLDEDLITPSDEIKSSGT
jgi:hypothetical protein